MASVLNIMWHRIKELLLETMTVHGHTEQGLCLFLIFVIDLSKYGISWLKGTDKTGVKHRKKKSNKSNKQGLNLVNTTAVSYPVAKYIRSMFAVTPVYLLNEIELIDEMIKHKILCRKVKLIGFDCEWVSGGSTVSNNAGGFNGESYSPIALLQIATPSECFLIRVCCLQNSLPKFLKEVLENRHILKFGVGVEEDCKRLRMLGIEICGTVDLRFLIQRCYHKSDIIKFPKRITGLSLSSLADAIVGLKMEKSYRVRCSNWESKILGNRQIAYAANDAIVALQIFLALCIEKVQSKKMGPLSKSLQIIEPRPTGDELLLISFVFGKCNAFNQASLTVKSSNIWRDFMKATNINEEVIKVGFSLCQGIVDLAFKEKSSIFRQKSSSDSNLPKLSQKSSVPTRKTPLYHNCLLLAPDGCLLCTCDKKKAEWYVLKNLGTVANSEPYTVKLNFDPSGRPFVDRDYYTTVKKNICVVCGKGENYVKKMIVPRDYRRHFPSSFKDHLSHDVLLLCVTCHRFSELHDMQLKKKLAEKYSTPLGNSQSIEDPTLKRVRSAAKALLYAEDKIPEQRRCSLREVLKEFLKKEDVDKDELKRLSEIGTSKENKFYEGPHGERVVAYLTENGDLKQFIMMWREHFLKTMKPKFLPDFWSIDHNLSLTGETST